MAEATIEVFLERCMGAGNCAEVAPAYFDQDAADGTVVVLQDQVPSEDRALVDKAAAVCPVAAILVQDRG
jgi:ferredoxin